MLSNFGDITLDPVDNTELAFELLLFIQESIKNNQWELLKSKRNRVLSLGDALISNNKSK